MATIAEELAAAAVTDSFLRNENPLSNGAKWAKPSWCTLIGQCEASTGWKGATTFPTGPDGARWETLIESAGFVYAIIELNSYSSSQEPERWWAAWACMDATKQNGYRVRVEETTKGSDTHNIILEKLVEGAVTELGKVAVAIKPTKKPAVAVVVGGGNVYAFLKTEEAATWTEQIKKADATYSSGRSGFEGRGNLFRGQNFRTGTFIGEGGEEEEEGIHKPNSATANVSVPTPEISAPMQPDSALVNASVPSGVELVGGAAISATEREAKGLPLPFPSVLANPGRLGPPRFTSAERKTLRIDRNG